MHELMISLDDARHTVEAEDYYLITPEIFKNKILENKKLKPVAENFIYASDTNTAWLSREELGNLLRKKATQ